MFDVTLEASGDKKTLYLFKNLKDLSSSHNQIIFNTNNKENNQTISTFSKEQNSTIYGYTDRKNKPIVLKIQENNW